jgi:intracellular sulfur oxidation DsrE/DsrF family protein
MVLKEGSPFAEKIKELDVNDRVSIKVCEGTMKRYEVDKSDLLPDVQTVPDAIMEIVRKQSQGWGYIKESHN